MLLLAQNMTKQVQQFFDWWFHELGLLTPNWLRKLVSTARPQLFIRLHNFQVFITYYEQDIEKTLLEFYLHKEGIAQQAAFFKAHPQWQQATKILLLSPKQLLKTRLDLPLAAQSNLRQVISYELDRYTPFTPEQCYFAAHIVGKNSTGNRLMVELLFIYKPKLHLHCQTLSEIGLGANIIAHNSDAENYRANPYALPYNFLPNSLRNQQGQKLKQVKRLLLICFLALTGIAIALPFWAQQTTLDKLQQQVASAKRQALEVDSIETETTALLQAEQKIIALKQEAPMILNILEQLSKLLPKDTWLRQFEYAEHKFILQGLSASASDLIGLLEDSPYFKQTTLVSPVTRDSQEPLDQFQLETTLESVHDVQ